MKWTKEETDFLINNYGIITYPEMTNKIKRPIHSLSLKARRLGITKHHKVRKWSTEEDKFLEENYKTLPYNQIAKIFNRTLASIFLHTQIKGLVKFKEINWSKEETEFLLN